jgi:hypothetical protein
MRIRFRIPLVTLMRIRILICVSCGSRCGCGFLFNADADPDADPGYQNDAAWCSNGNWRYQTQSLGNNTVLSLILFHPSLRSTELGYGYHTYCTILYNDAKFATFNINKQTLPPDTSDDDSKGLSYCKVGLD